MPYYLRFVFDPDSVQAGEESRIVIKTVDAQGDDHFRLIEPLVSVGIKDSTEYGTLSYNEFGPVIGDVIDSVQTLLISDEFSGVELKFLANENVPTQTFPVTLFAKKTDEGLSFFPIPPSLYPFPGRDTVKGEGKLRLVAVPDSLDHFEVIVQPDTIKHGDTSTVRIQAKDVNNINVHPPPNTLKEQKLTFVITGPNDQSWTKEITVSVSSPERFELFQNYPNPFNPVTTISYQLTTNSKVSLRIYNLLGQEVKVLVDGEKEAGYHQETWNASAVASGMYIYQLVTKDQKGKDIVAQKRMVIVQ